MNSQLQVPPAFLSVADAARYCGITRSRLYMWLATGRIDMRRAGRRTIIKRASLDAFLAALPPADLGEAPISRRRAEATETA